MGERGGQVCRTLISLYRERRTMKNIALLSLLTLASTGTSTISWNGQCVRCATCRFQIQIPTIGPDLKIPPMSPVQCGKICKHQGFLFAGVQYGQQCWCGNDAPPKDKIVDMAECDFRCSGDSTQRCGGAGRKNVYRIDDQTVSPTLELSTEPPTTEVP